MSDLEEKKMTEEKAALDAGDGKEAQTVLKEQKAEGAKSKKKSKKTKGRKGSKKKIKKRYVVIGIIVIIVLGLFVFSRVTAKDTVMPVPCAAAYTGDVEENISASGKVESANKETYFAPVGAKVAEVNVSVGDEVKAGDLLLTFDLSALEFDKQKADLEVSQSVNGYQSALQESNEHQSDYSEATVGLDELKQMEENQKQYVQGLKYELEDDIASKKEDLYEWDRKLQEELGYQNRKLSGEEPGGEGADSIQEVIDNLQRQRTDVQNELSMLDNDENLKQKQRQIDFEEKKLSDMTEEIQRRESKQSSSEGGILNGYSKQEKEAMVESAKLSAQQTAEKLDVAAAGVTAEFDGIVTEVTAQKGAAIAEGTQLFTVESNKDVKVTVELSKYDLEKVKEGQKADLVIAGTSYEGTVTKIIRMAQNNEQNTPVVKAEIKVENPDDSLFLGVEGKASIHTAQSEGTVLVPYEAVNTDKDGDFCYLVKDGIIVKQRIVTGISDEIAVEVKEGISEGDTVVTASNMNLEEGMQVMPVIQ